HAAQVVQPGKIIDTAGQVIGEHQGLAFYTIGQRKGLGITAPQPLYVLRKEMVSNTLVVGSETELGQPDLIANDVNWISGQPPREPFRAQVKIRYKAVEAWAAVMPLADSRAGRVFEQPRGDITPGQRVVFYQDELCLGGGTIE